jgi:hypothetical protein
MASQMIIYAEAVMNFCEKTIPGNINHHRFVLLVMFISLFNHFK